MTARAILERTKAYADLVDEFGGASIGYDVNPRATAIAELFAHMLLGVHDAGVSLEDLVMPELLAQWRTAFGDPAQIEQLAKGLRSTAAVAPRVLPQSDGSTIVLFVPTHPEATEPALIRGPQYAQIAAEIHLRLVAQPDDWRVSAVRLNPETAA